jgi:hypothetical protein
MELIDLRKVWLSARRPSERLVVLEKFERLSNYSDIDYYLDLESRMFSHESVIAHLWNVYCRIIRNSSIGGTL